MGIPAAWMPVLGAYDFPVTAARKNACWGIAAGAWDDPRWLEEYLARVQVGCDATV